MSELRQDSAGVKEAATKHISVCICTYKRPDFLKRLLNELARQQTEGLFTFSIVVAENDRLQAAEGVVSEFASASSIPVKYCVEPRQNIALARNKAVENARGDFVAFIDDDEFPAEGWLVTLFKAINHYGADGVLGPVQPHFDHNAPQWVVAGGFYERPRHQTGLVLNWRQTRTGNTLLKSHLFLQATPPFRAECLAGEDMDFFRRLMKQGYEFIWCNEAIVYEALPPARCTRSFLIRRALFRGEASMRNSGLLRLFTIKSFLVIPVYAAVLPLALIFGQATFMRLLFKLCYHAGRLLPLMGITCTTEPAVSE